MRFASYLAVLAAALAVGAFGAWVLWHDFDAGHSPRYLLGVSSIVASIGMIARQSWSRFLVYPVAAFVCVAGLASILGAWYEGELVTHHALKTFWSLAPGLSMISVAIACTFVAARFLGPRRYRPDTSLERTREG